MYLSYVIMGKFCLLCTAIHILCQILHHTLQKEDQKNFCLSCFLDCYTTRRLHKIDSGASNMFVVCLLISFRIILPNYSCFL